MKNIFDWKTTIIGTALLFGAGYNHFWPPEGNIWVTSGFGLLGIAFWFFPNDVINIIRNFIRRKSDEI